jgi:hypothetical protein
MIIKMPSNTEVCPSMRSILEISLKSPCLHTVFGWASFNPLTPLFVVPYSKEILLNLRMKCRNSVRNAESQHLKHKFKRNYSSCTGRSSENLCSSNGGAQEKRKTGWNSGTIKIDGFLSFTPPLNANVQDLDCKFCVNFLSFWFPLTSYCTIYNCNVISYWSMASIKKSIILYQVNFPLIEKLKILT